MPATASSTAYDQRCSWSSGSLCVKGPEGKTANRTVNLRQMTYFIHYSQRESSET